MHIKWLLLIPCWGFSLVCTQNNIPKYLRECYQNTTIHGPQLPMNLPILIDIVRKAERYSHTSMDMRMISASLLHRFRFDGIEYYSEVKVKDGVLPFSGTGPQRAKHRLIEELIPGNPEAFPSDALTLTERCALHRAISNTIWEHSAAAEDKLCTEGVTEKISDRSMPGEAKLCPIEYGVVLTPFGTIAPGPVIAAIAASLQPQNVTVKLLLKVPNADPPEVNNNTDKYNYNEDEVDLLVPKSEMALDRSMWLKLISRSTTQIDNIWIATAAGDLAEMVLYQGPVVGKRMELGATGFWNSSMRPNIFYLMGRDGTFDATRAEILGAIDGLIIAKNLPGWIEKFHNLRLSQVLDMYYSDKGLTFDAGIKACNRGKSFWHVAPKSILEEQVYATSQVLGYRSSVAYMTEEVLEAMVNHAVNTFSSYTNNHLFTELHCHKAEEVLPRVEVIIIFDGAWSVEYTADFLSVIINDFDVSVFGSKIGLIHGSSGDWLLNVTNSPAEAHFAIANFKNITWPTQIHFEKVLKQAITYLDADWNEKHKNHMIGNLGQVIIFLAPRSRFNTVEQQSILKSIEGLKAQHPDVHFIYYVSDNNAQLFRPFLLTEEDHLIRSFSVNDITDVLLGVSRVLRPGPCNEKVTEGVRDQIEDYVSPRQSVIYRLHPYWRRNTKQVTITAHNVGYGTIEICTWNQHKNNIRKEGLYCRELSGHTDTTIIDYATCNDDTACNTTHYEIRGISSRKQCTEIDCRMPDYIRYIIRVENLHCSKSTNYSPNIICFIIVTALLILS